MGKKSKSKKKLTNKAARCKAVGGTAVASAASSATESVPSGPVDRQGRMPEAESRRFYALLDFLALIVAPRIQKEMPTLRWEDGGCAANTAESRAIVMDYILLNIESISKEIDSKQHDARFRRKLERRMTESERSDIRSWRVHIADDFFVVDHIPEKGSVVVQVGTLLQNNNAEEIAPCYRDEDVHEPRVFLLRGLATPFGEICKRPAEYFAETHPHIKHRGFSLALVNITIIPYGGGLTYMTNVTPYSQQHYKTPASFADAARIAVEAYQAAFSSGSGGPPLYTNLTEEDIDICRLTSSAEISFQKKNQQKNLLYGERHERDKSSSANTSVRCAIMLWNPISDTNEPRFDDFLVEAAFGPRPVAEMREGFKRQVVQEMLVNDDEPCPFHRHLGEGEPFKSCCKALHLERSQEVYFYNPLGEEVGEFVSETNSDPLKLARFALIDTCSVRVKVAPAHVATIKERLDSSYLFHATNPDKWNYLGYAPAVWKGMGMVVFGDVTLDESGMFVSEGMTCERVEALICAMRDICDGIPVEEAGVVSTTFNKRKIDKEASSRNKQLVNESFGDLIDRSLRAAHLLVTVD